MQVPNLSEKYLQVVVKNVHISLGYLFFYRKFSSDVSDLFYFDANFLDNIHNCFHCLFCCWVHFILLITVFIDLVAKNVIQLSDLYLRNNHYTPNHLVSGVIINMPCLC